MSKQVDEVMAIIAVIMHRHKADLDYSDASEQLRAKLEEMSPPDGWEVSGYQHDKTRILISRVVNLDGTLEWVNLIHGYKTYPTARAAMTAAEGSEG